MSQHEFELSFANLELLEKNNFSVILETPHYNGWYKYHLQYPESDIEDIIIRFRMPHVFRLYGDVLRTFKKEERLLGIHRFLIGKDLEDEISDLLIDPQLSEKIMTLEKEKVTEILNRMKNMVTLDCNKIPYLHIRVNKESTINVDNTILKFLNKQKEYLNILRDVLNEKITIKKAVLKSQNAIFCEYLEINK